VAEWRKLLSEGNVSASDVASGTLSTSRIPSLAASKITSGTLGTARIPSLAASKINSGTFDVARIPSMSASKITSGTIADARLPSDCGANTTYLTSHQDISGKANLGGALFTGDIGLGTGSTTNKITLGTTSWNNWYRLNSYWSEFSNNQNEGFKFISDGNTSHIQLQINNRNQSGGNGTSSVTAYGDFYAGGSNKVATESWVTSQNYISSQSDSQTLSISGQVLTISGGNNVTLPDADTQDLSISGRVISLTSGGSVTVPASSSNDFTSTLKTKLDNITELANRYALSSAAFNTSTGVLTISGNASDAVTVDLDGRYLTSQTDSQTLSISGTTLSISGGNNVTLPDNDTQDLSISGRTISLTSGGSVTVPETTNASSLTSGTVPDARLPGDCGARTTYDNYSKWTIANSLLDSGAEVASTNLVVIEGGTGISVARSTRRLTASLSSGAALSNLGGGSGTTFLRKDGTWISPQDANTFRTVTAGGNTLGSSETLAFTAGSNVSISESGGAVTINSHPTTYSAGTGLTLGGGYFALATGGVTSTHIANNTISATDMNIGGTATTYYPLTFAPTGGGMYWAQIKTAAIENDAVTNAKIGAGAVGSGELSSNSVSTAKIADDAVTNAKIADNAVQGDIIADETIASGKLADDSVSSDNIIDGSISTGKLANGSVTAAKLNSDVNTVYTMQWSNQITVRSGYYYTPNGTYGANYYSSIPTQVTYSGAFYCLPIVVPKAGKIVKWGWHGAFNSSLVGNVSWRLYQGSMSSNSTGSGTLSQVGTTQTINCNSGRYYEFKNTGLSVSISEDYILLPVCNGSSSSTKYGRGHFYVVIEYDV